MSIFNKIFGDANEKNLKKIKPIIEKINSYEKKYKEFSEAQMKEKTAEFKSRLKNNETLDALLPESFALVREASKRTLNQRHFDVQLIGGIIMHQGKIAEMKTGEGKTLSATLPLYLNALEEKGAQLITVNDYLAKRDAVWMGQIYDLLGLSVGCITHEQAFLYDSAYTSKNPKSQIPNPNDQNSKQDRDKERDVLGGFRVVESYLRPVSRKEAYQADITYGTNNEFGFDYLRDNMVYDLKDKVQRGFHYAIIDEVDSILIDEARTPLIISAPEQESTDKYYLFSRVVADLEENQDYEIDEKTKTANFTELGQNKIVKKIGRDPWAENDITTTHQLEAALRAKTLFKKDQHYVVKDIKGEKQIVIVDDFTGRLMPGRRWSGGLHQAVEAKEGVKVQEESKILASITFQNYFRMYKKLAGMTGTAVTSAEELDKVYKLEVMVVPTNKPMQRKDLADRIYKSAKGKYKAVIKEIKERNKRGQPILVGTVSIEKNELLGKLLEREGIPHQVLNAKNHEKEGEIIAQAGKPGAVTIATNMAGRGVDIILGGNPVHEESQKEVIRAGGLHVIGTERHEARRIDNQLRGRSGRQGDPGSSQFFVSLEDDLMRIFGGDRIKSMMETLKVPEDQPIEAGLVSKALESAQTKIEGMNFDLRKHILEYDDVMNKQREIFYKKRNDILKKSQIPNSKSQINSNDQDFNSQNGLKNYMLEIIKKAGFKEEDYIKKEKEVGENNMRQLEKIVSLKVLDTLWIEHLDVMNHLLDSVRLRAYGQQDPLVEYKKEGHRMFKELLEIIDFNIANNIMKAQARPQSQAKAINQSPPLWSARGAGSGGLESGSPEIPARQKKIGRNDPCPCGKKYEDGRSVKYKRCCGA